MYFCYISIRRDTLSSCDCHAVLNARRSVPKQLLLIASQVIAEACALMCTVILQDRVSLVKWLSALILHAALICKKICSFRHCPFGTVLIWKWENENENLNCKTGPKTCFSYRCWLFFRVQLWLPVKHLKTYLDCNRQFRRLKQDLVEL